MYKLNFNHLYYFQVIAEEGSIVKASKRLHMTQPALSHQLKNLEVELGEQLFERKGRKLAINDFGNHVLGYVQKIFRQSEEMIQFLKSDRSLPIKHIKVGVTPRIPNDFIFGITKSLISIPSIKVQIFQGSTRELQEDLKEGKIDILICDSNIAPRSRKIRGHFLHEEEIICISSAKRKIKGKFPENLNNFKMIQHMGTSLIGDAIEKFLSDRNIKMSVVGELSSTSLLLDTVERSSVVSFVPLSAAKNRIKNKTIYRVGKLEGVKLAIWAITKKNIKKDGVISNILSQFIDSAL